MKHAIWLLAAAIPLAAQPKLLINAQVQTSSIFSTAFAPPLGPSPPI